jgi:hypothetical protein
MVRRIDGRGCSSARVAVARDDAADRVRRRIDDGAGGGSTAAAERRTRARRRRAPGRRARPRSASPASPSARRARDRCGHDRDLDERGRRDAHGDRGRRPGHGRRADRPLRQRRRSRRRDVQLHLRRARHLLLRVHASLVDRRRCTRRSSCGDGRRVGAQADGDRARGAAAQGAAAPRRFDRLATLSQLARTRRSPTWATTSASAVSADLRPRHARRQRDRPQAVPGRLVPDPRVLLADASARPPGLKALAGQARHVLGPARPARRRDRGRRRGRRGLRRRRRRPVVPRGRRRRLRRRGLRRRQGRPRRRARRSPSSSTAPARSSGWAKATTPQAADPARRRCAPIAR